MDSVHPDDLPFAINELPGVFTPFRKRVEALGDNISRPPLPVPANFKPYPTIPYTDDYGALMDDKSVAFTLDYLLQPLIGQTAYKYDQHGVKSAFPYSGGETSALDRLQWYFHSGGNPPPVARYKQTRNHLLGHAYSTKMSPFLVVGAISPRVIVQALKEHEAEFGSSQNTYWVQFELLWRDYFFYICKKFGSALFKVGGFEEVTDPKQAEAKKDYWKWFDPHDKELQKWLVGRTGVPFLDANLVELNQSGYVLQKLSAVR